MRNILPALVAVALLVAFGVAEGRWTGRWTADQRVADAAARLKNVPLSLGDWTGVDNELDPEAVRKAELAGYVLRQYTHKPSGATISLLLVCGRPGPVALHTPDICYGGIGFAMADAEGRQVVGPGGANAFRSGKFQNLSGPVPEYLRILWGWSPDGKSWSGPGVEPRWAFAASPVLYKLYVVRHVANLSDPDDGDPSPGFLRQLLPVLETTLAAFN